MTPKGLLSGVKQLYWVTLSETKRIPCQHHGWDLRQNILLVLKGLGLFKFGLVKDLLLPFKFMSLIKFGKRCPLFLVSVMEGNSSSGVRSRGEVYTRREQGPWVTVGFGVTHGTKITVVLGLHEKGQVSSMYCRKSSLGPLLHNNIHLKKKGFLICKM